MKVQGVFSSDFVLILELNCFGILLSYKYYVLIMKINDSRDELPDIFATTKTLLYFDPDACW